MVFSLFVAVLAGVSWALLGLCYKAAEHRMCRPMPFAISFMLTAAVVAACKLPFERTEWSAPGLWLISLAVGVVSFAIIPLLTYANRLGPASISWTMLNLGLLIPILLGPVLFREPLHSIDYGLLALFIAMLLAFARSMATENETKTRDFRFAMIAVAVFLLEGAFLLGSKGKATLFGDANSAAYTTLLYLIGAGLASLTHRLGKDRSPLHKSEWYFGALAGTASSAGSLFLLSAMDLRSVVVYPITMGISLLGGAVLTIAVYRERLNAFKSLGLALGLIVLLMATCRSPIARWWDHQVAAAFTRPGITGIVHSDAVPSVEKDR